MKVAYIDATTYSDTKEEGDYSVKYIAYSNKDKKNIINNDYDPKCIYGDKGKNCYTDFETYTITLRKASDKKYYFDEIKKKN